MSPADDRKGAGPTVLLRRIEERLEPVLSAMAILAALAGAAIVGLICASVGMRYFAFAPFRFTEELVGLLMTAAFLLALPLVTLKADHVRIRALVAILPDRTRGVVGGFAGLLGIVFCVWFLALSIPWLEFAVSRGIRTEVGRLLLYPWMVLLPVSMVLTATAFLIRIAPADEMSGENAGTRHG